MKKLMSVQESKEGIANDLLKLYKLLYTHGLCLDSSQLNFAEGECRRNSDENTWTYSIMSLELYIDKLPHTIPLEIVNLSARLSVEIEGYYYNEGNISNPLKSLNQFDIEIVGIDKNGNPLISSWHLDKHIHNDGDGDGKLIHPEYHITYGGKIMENSGYEFGASIIQRSPRVLHPPMDAVLGIDFILRNYVYKEFTEDLFAESEYQQAVNNSKQRLWKSYYIALASHWHDFDELYNIDKEFARTIISH